MIRLLPGAVMIAAGLASAAGPAHAQSSRSVEGAPLLSTDEAGVFSMQIEEALRSDDVEVALVFRTGRKRADLPDGIQFTHGAFWVRQTVRLPDGAHADGYLTYNLFHHDGETGPRTRSYLSFDAPIFFVAGVAENDVGVIVPTPEMQERILDVMMSPLYAELHNPDYSLVSNPLDANYMNCNEFMLHVVAAAGWGVTSGEEVRERLGTRFQPDLIEAGPLERFFAPWWDERLRTDDHIGGVRTTTFRSIAALMEQEGWLEKTVRMERDPAFAEAIEPELPQTALGARG